ncbi:glycosyl transferase family 1 [Fictibacillus phosphorivorans]|uniref:Glycosyl transferase family 1 n=1 Tax=Fictibacillus phosphorivorans TaxID=1221500 RepID=A0A163SGE6_9BACL|nr:glycosyltransferase [Fictibacillus phosphorivorans]KZE69018.1 glycosyl transferase family 1 [Fictibacillus phosphorivorans]
MKNYQVVWRGPVLDATGYGTASREYALALDRQGIDVKIETYTWNFPYHMQDEKKKKRLQQLIEKPITNQKQKILIYHSPPAVISKKEKADFDFCILNTVWETNRIPDTWLPILSTYDAVSVPCTHNVDALKISGVRIPIFLVPHGADTKMFNPDNHRIMLNEKTKFVFVSIFDFQHRKNPESLLRAYWEEFTVHDRVLLLIKTYGSSRKKIRKAIMDYKRKLGFSDTAPIYLMTGICSEAELKGMYTAANAFVLPTRGEGVGLPFIEALSSGIPVIATGWGGQMDFLSTHNSFLIDYELMNPSISMNSDHAISTIYREFEKNGQLWAEADLDHMKKQMRYAYENPALCRLKGRQGRKDMQQMTWDRAGISLKQMVEKIIGS